MAAHILNIIYILMLLDIYSQYYASGDSAYQELYNSRASIIWGKERRGAAAETSPPAAAAFLFSLLFSNQQHSVVPIVCFPYTAVFSFFFSYSSDYYHLDIPAAFDGKWSSWLYVLCVRCVCENFPFYSDPPRAPRPIIIYEFSWPSTRRFIVGMYYLCYINYMQRNIIRMRKLDYRQEAYNWSQQHAD